MRDVFRCMPNVPHVLLPVPQVPSLGMAPLPPSGDAARARPGNAALWCDAAQHGTSASAHLFAVLLAVFRNDLIRDESLDADDPALAPSPDEAPPAPV